MNLVDSCGWLEYLAGGKNAEFYASALENESQLVVPVICIYEVFKKVLKERGEDQALQAAALMHRGLVAELDAGLALEAARLGHLHKLPLADSLVLATAQKYKAILWTQDAHFKGLDGVRFAGKIKA
jgi:predicted nucleic acid-binding protein